VDLFIAKVVRHRSGSSVESILAIIDLQSWCRFAATGLSRCYDDATLRAFLLTDVDRRIIKDCFQRSWRV